MPVLSLYRDWSNERNQNGKTLHKTKPQQLASGEDVREIYSQKVVLQNWSDEQFAQLHAESTRSA